MGHPSKCARGHGDRSKAVINAPGAPWGMAWHGVAWRGMAWHGVAWRGSRFVGPKALGIPRAWFHEFCYHSLYDFLTRLQ